ncbi:MAG: PspC domain-containing protein [Trueperaceae bacterium]|nr:PspC domain-containing protein [Trueperaceae bacterium]
MTQPEKTDVLNHDHRRARRPNTGQPLRRSKQRLVAGIAGGVARYINTNPLYIRLIFIFLLVLSVGLVALPYLVLWLLIPSEA